MTKNTKPKKSVSKARFMFQNTQKNASKTLENLETDHNTQKKQSDS